MTALYGGKNKQIHHAFLPQLSLKFQPTRAQKPMAVCQQVGWQMGSTWKFGWFAGSSCRIRANAYAFAVCRLLVAVSVINFSRKWRRYNSIDDWLFKVLADELFIY
jgi:hypothetical protein